MASSSVTIPLVCPNAVAVLNKTAMMSACFFIDNLFVK
jgi:hypothetical protein